MSRRLYFFDDRDVAARWNLHLTPGPVEKCGVADMDLRPSDLERALCFAGSVVPMPDGTYRLYYSATRRAEPRSYNLALAESRDGLRWEKPDLGQVQHEGLETNWIWPEGMPAGESIVQPQVVQCPDGRWLMWFWWHGHHIGRMRYLVAESEDGIRWRIIDLKMPHIMHPADLELGQNALVAGLTAADPKNRFAAERTMDWWAAKRLRSNDATYVYYNERTRMLEMYSVWLLPIDAETRRMTPHDNAPRVLRTIHRRESRDGIEWSDPEMLILADENDPLHQQFYYLAVQPEGEWNLGFLGHYRCWEQTMDIELCFSRDTHHWLRPLRGGWIPRGPVPEPDCMGAYATNRLIDGGDNWIVLYQGVNSMHNGKLPEGVAAAHSEIMTAQVPKGRFAGLKSTERMIGRLLLKPFNHVGEHFVVNAEVRGVLRAELRDPFGRPLPGYELNSAVPVHGDSSCHVLTWEGGKTGEEFRYDTLALRLEVEDGTVYSVEV
ncbi:MAG: hypothetical protein ABFE16_19810 [Armatimonadia bacterium]